MAARRIAKSAVDWAAFAERVPPNQIDAYRAFKARSDMFISRIHKHPESLPKIDWAFYRSRIASPGMVDQFEKAYGGVTVEYPKDKTSMAAEIDEQKQKAEVQSKEYIAQITQAMAAAQAVLAKIDSVPPVEDMTHEMYAQYFPDQARDPWEKPTFWPHTQSYQPENDPHNVK